jgi:hypothetical protein
MTDVRSALAVTLLNADPAAYTSLVAGSATPPRARDLLDNVEPDQLLSVPVTSPVAAHAMLAALWLWHDGLDECHRIVQKSPEEVLAATATAGKSGTSRLKTLSVASPGPGADPSRDPAHLRDMTATFAFWHAIMHRREGDFSNSKYWYARCAGHPTLQVVAANAGKIVNQFPADKSVLRLVATGWNPSAFVDLVELVHDRPGDPRHGLAVALQKLEWHWLFDHCVRAATQGVKPETFNG